MTQMTQFLISHGGLFLFLAVVYLAIQLVGGHHI